MNLKRNLLAAATAAAFTLPSVAFAGDDPGPLVVSVAYAGKGGTRPGIWAGSPNVIFVGTSEPYDSGAIKLHNQNFLPITVTKVSVDIGSKHGIDIWEPALPIVIKPGKQLVLAQTSFENFDTSDMRGCTTGKPIIHITAKVGSQTAVVLNFADEDQALCGMSEGTAHWSKAEAR